MQEGTQRVESHKVPSEWELFLRFDECVGAPSFRYAALEAEPASSNCGTGPGRGPTQEPAITMTTEASLCGKAPDPITVVGCVSPPTCH